MSTIVFIGGGNMARSLIGGLLNGSPAARRIIATDIDQPQLTGLYNDFGIDTHTDNAEAVKNAATVVIAVKPHIVRTVCSQISGALPKSAVVVSIAAGVREADISNWLGGEQAIIRCMPNTPALLGAGISGLFANALATEQHKLAAEAVLGAAGDVVWVNNEGDLDSITALSGSGPAYFFHMIECMTDTAIDMGLSAETAELLAIETAYGAALMARQRSASPAVLRENVTSKGGTTAAALASFYQDDLAGVVGRAMRAARDRAEQLGDEFGQASDSQ